MQRRHSDPVAFWAVGATSPPRRGGIQAAAASRVGGTKLGLPIGLAVGDRLARRRPTIWSRVTLFLVRTDRAADPYLDVIASERYRPALTGDAAEVIGRRSATEYSFAGNP